MGYNAVMIALRRLTALSLCISLILAQGQEAFAALAVAVPVKTGGTPVSAAALGGVVGLRPGGTAAPDSSLRLSLTLKGVLPSVGIPPGFKADAQAPAPTLAPALQSVLPSVGIRPESQAEAAASPLSAVVVGAGHPVSPAQPALSALDSALRLEAPAGSPSETAPSRERTERIAALFDGGAAKLGRDSEVPVLPADAGIAPSSRLPSLGAPVRRGPAAEGGALRPAAPPSRKAPSSFWGLIKANRFLIAAAGGALIGFAGVNLGLLPVLSLMPGLFFGTLPWLAAPFIGLNVYKSFAHYSVVKESRTLLGFLVITAAGLAISAGVTIGMTALLPVVNPASFAAAAIPGLATGGFSPMQFMLPIIGLFTGAALLYKRARSVNSGSEKGRQYQPGWRGALARLYDQAAGLVVNSRTAPFIERAGRLGEKGTDLINELFPRFIDIVGIPAVATLLSMTMATGGLGLLSSFGGYYITALTGMAAGFVVLLAAYAAFGARGKDFKEILKAAAFGFSISSSSATMPTEKEALKAMGVSAKTRNTVVPLGGVFNMFGTALYMGLTAFYALSMFGAAPTLAQYLNTALTVLVIAMGAPGIPASNITLLDPVLRQTGLESGAINKVYTMILPADRILDMVQTALNVLGDMLPAVEQDRTRLRYVRVKNIREIRRKRAEAGH